VAVDQERWDALNARQTPEWFRKAKLGFFIHWGPYSVPAWAEPTAELGTVESATEWYTHNPYSEWYYNTIRLDGSAAQRHQQEAHGGRPYDDFIDEWQAENFDASAIVGELAEAGADYIVLTTKHHDGVCLWDAPGTERNTVARGPRKDLVGAYADACKEHGVRFGAYYSGGLDWHERPYPPIGASDTWSWDGLRPLDAEYAAYAAEHVRDLVRRYQPDVLWNDIEWPDEGKNFEDHGIGKVFEEYFEAKPDGIVNDRWQVPHKGYSTSEYQHLLDAEGDEEWENCRGVGLSFAYNQEEGLEHALAGPMAVRHLIDVVTRGGRLLFGVGPMADGRLPQWQSDVVASLGEWMRPAGEFLQVKPTKRTLDFGDDVWVRLGEAEDGATLAFISADRPVEIDGDLLTPQWASLTDGVLTVASDAPGPVVVRLASCFHDGGWTVVAWDGESAPGLG
jgi:alpha-L-fucosidase